MRSSALFLAFALCALSTAHAADDAAAAAAADGAADGAADAPPAAAAAEEKKAHAAVESEDEYTMSPEELKAMQDEMKAAGNAASKAAADEEANANVEDGPDQGPSDNGPRMEGGVFWIMLLAVYGSWLAYHAFGTVKDLIPALKELAGGGKAKQEDGAGGGKSRRGNKGAAGSKGKGGLKIANPALLKKLAILVVGYLVWSVSSGMVASSMDHLGSFDPYATLGVSTSDSLRDVKKAYRALSMKWHPDKNKDETDRELVKRNFMKVNKAFKIINKEHKGEKVTAEDYAMDTN